MCSRATNRTLAACGAVYQRQTSRLDAHATPHSLCVKNQLWLSDSSVTLVQFGEDLRCRVGEAVLTAGAFGKLLFDAIAHTVPRGSGRAAGAEESAEHAWAAALLSCYLAHTPLQLSLSLLFRVTERRRADGDSL